MGLVLVLLVIAVARALTLELAPTLNLIGLLLQLLVDEIRPLLLLRLIL